MESLIQDFYNVYGYIYFENITFLFQKHPHILCIVTKIIKARRCLLYIWFYIKDQISDFCFRNLHNVPFGKGQYFGSLVNDNQCLMKQSVAVLRFLLWHLIILSFADPQMAFFNPENSWLTTFYFWPTCCSHIVWKPLLSLLFATEIFMHFLAFLNTLPNLHANLSFQTLFQCSLHKCPLL